MCASLAGTAQEILFLHLTVHTGITPWHAFKCVHKGRICKKKRQCASAQRCIPWILPQANSLWKTFAGTNPREGGEQKGSVRLRPVIMCELFRAINEGYSGLQGLQHIGSADVLGAVWGKESSPLYFLSPPRQAAWMLQHLPVSKLFCRQKYLK